MMEKIEALEKEIRNETDPERVGILLSLQRDFKRLYLHDRQYFIAQFEELIKAYYSVSDYISRVFGVANRYDNPMKRYGATFYSLGATSMGCFSYTLSTDLEHVAAYCWDGSLQASGPIGVDGYCLFGFYSDCIKKLEILRKEWVGGYFAQNISNILLGEMPIAEVTQQYQQMRALLLASEVKDELYGIMRYFEEPPVIFFMQGAYNLLYLSREIKTMNHCFDVIRQAYREYSDLYEIKRDTEAELTLQDLHAEQLASLRSLHLIQKLIYK